MRSTGNVRRDGTISVIAISMAFEFVVDIRAFKNFFLRMSMSMFCVLCGHDRYARGRATSAYVSCIDYFSFLRLQSKNNER
jgi:hypothetical protein